MALGKNPTHYIDNEEFFKEICEWQDYDKRLYWINVLKDGIKESELGIENVKLDNEEFYTNMKNIKNLEKEQATQLRKQDKLIKKRIKEYTQRISIYEEKIESIVLTPLERVKYKKLYNRLGIKINDIINHFATKPCYRNYPFLEDMKMLAIEHCIKGLNKFDRNETQNVFGYFTFSVWHAFLQEIAKEKKLMNDKFNYIKNFVSDEMLSYDYNVKEDKECFNKAPQDTDIDELYMDGEIDSTAEGEFKYF